MPTSQKAENDKVADRDDQKGNGGRFNLYGMMLVLVFLYSGRFMQLRHQRAIVPITTPVGQPAVMNRGTPKSHGVYSRS